LREILRGDKIRNILRESFQKHLSKRFVDMLKLNKYEVLEISLRGRGFGDERVGEIAQAELFHGGKEWPEKTRILMKLN
jgi:hypothetical protein